MLVYSADYTKHGELQKYDIQMQVNTRAALTSPKAVALAAVASVEVSVEEPTCTAAEIEALLLAHLIREGR